MGKRLTGSQQRQGTKWLARHIATQNNLCALCSGPMAAADDPTATGMKPPLDHILPRSRGGRHSIANTQAVHASCNNEKGDRVLPQGQRPWPPRNHTAGVRP